MGEIVNGWQIARDLGHYGTRYDYRAAWTFFAVGRNLVEDAVYPLALADADGNTFHGADRYELHFAKDEIPPVDAFWSLTMYDADSYLADNAINRYALGDRDPLTFDHDGSLTLYLPRESPGDDKESNWLRSARRPCARQSAPERPAPIRSDRPRTPGRGHPPRPAAITGWRRSRGSLRFDRIKQALRGLGGGLGVPSAGLRDRAV
jgi:hypothetical protein